MAKPSTDGLTLDRTAAEIIRLHPHMLEFFDALGVDDCCLELDLQTIAAHHGHDPAELMTKVQQALESGDQ